MGMAASQARLLMITSRLHDVELRAQQLQNAKLLLATQEDEAYEEYQKALDATTFTANLIDEVSSQKSDIPVTFSNLFSLGAAMSTLHPSNGANYILVDKNGRVVVEDDIYEGYQAFNSFGGNGYVDNAYVFAMFMLNGQSAINHWQGGGYDNYLGVLGGLNNVWNEKKESDDNLAELMSNVAGYIIDMLDDPDYQVIDSNDDRIKFENMSSGTIERMYLGGSLIAAFAQIAESGGEWHGIHFRAADTTEKEEFDKLLRYMFSTYSNQICDDENVNYDDYGHDVRALNYYVRLYEAIQQHGGCIAISDFNGPDGSATSNNEWLTAMLQSGLMTVETVNLDSHGEVTCSGATVASESALSYTATTSIDKTVLAHAEAEYEHKLRVIDRKEQKIDRDLNKIETERNALTKQYDSIKKVSDENIDRTFGIFS